MSADRYSTVAVLFCLLFVFYMMSQHPTTCPPGTPTRSDKSPNLQLNRDRGIVVYGLINGNIGRSLRFSTSGTARNEDIARNIVFFLGIIFLESIIDEVAVCHEKSILPIQVTRTLSFRNQFKHTHIMQPGNTRYTSQMEGICKDTIDIWNDWNPRPSTELDLFSSSPSRNQYEHEPVDIKPSFMHIFIEEHDNCARNTSIMYDRELQICCAARVFIISVRTPRDMHALIRIAHRYKFNSLNVHYYCIQTYGECGTYNHGQDHFLSGFFHNTCSNSCTSITTHDHRIRYEEWNAPDGDQDYTSCSLKSEFTPYFQDISNSNDCQNSCSSANTHDHCIQVAPVEWRRFNCAHDRYILVSLSDHSTSLNNAQDWTRSVNGRRNNRFVVSEAICDIIHPYSYIKQRRTTLSENQSQQTNALSSISCHLRKTVGGSRNTNSVKSTPKLLLQWSSVLSRGTITKLLELTSLRTKFSYFEIDSVLINIVNRTGQFIFALVRNVIFPLCCILYFSRVHKKDGTPFKLSVSGNSFHWENKDLQLKISKSDRNILHQAEGKAIIDSVYAKFRHKDYELKKQLFDHSYMRPGRHVTDCNAIPASIDRYCSDVIKNESNSHDLMKYEWARYKSYETFPTSAVMLPTRLAKAGFYYTGRDEEVRCFCCGLLNGKWNEEETAMDVHCRLAPSCDFIKGNHTENVPIHAEEQATVRGNGYHTTSSTSDAREFGATGGAANTVHDVSSTLQDVPSGAFTVNGHCLSQTTEDVRSAMNKLTLTSHSQCTNSSLENARFNLPKHPQYASLAMRLSSFTGWRAHVSQQPRELADAGFFYIGYGDCVRCFSCGGGLKEWAYGDAPWVEHARYYPGCAFLKQCKGDEFIRMYRDQRSSTAGQAPGPVGNAGHGQTAGQAPGPVDSAGQSSVDMTGPVVEQVKEMGYPETVIQTAIRTFKIRHGSAVITTEQLMEILLNEDLESAQTSAVPSRQATPHDTTEVPRSSPHNPSGDITAHTPRQPNTASNGVSSETTGCSSTDKSNSGERETNRQNRVASNKKSPQRKEDGNTRGQNNSDISRREETLSLLEENRQLKSQLLCKICKKNDACMVMIPCGHLVSCPSCQGKFRKCPVCNAVITKKIRAYPA